MSSRKRITSWEEFDDMLTCIGDVEDMVNALWLIAGNPDISQIATGPLQTVAASASTRLIGLRKSLEGYMEDAMSTAATRSPAGGSDE